MKHMGPSNKSLFWQPLIISIVQGIILPDVIVLWVLFITRMISSRIFSASADSPHCVSCSGGIRNNSSLLYYKSSSFPELQYSPVFTGHLTKHPNVCNSPLITKQPDSPVAAAQPDEPIVLLCFWSELRGADCQGTARHFSASVAANLQIAPCRPKLMEGQFGGSKGLNGRPCAPITSWVWIHFLTFAACYPLLTSTFIISPLFYHVPVCCSPSTPTTLN